MHIWLHTLLHAKHFNTSLPLSGRLSKTNQLSVFKGTWDITWYSDEAWFQLSGYVKSQNTHLWATEHPHEIHEVPLHLEKTGVWCAISRRHIIGPIFFHETLNTAYYLEIFNEFVDQLDDDELRNGYFQQDGATCHTSNESMTEIESFFDFESLMAAKISWLKSARFFPLGRLKRKHKLNQPLKGHIPDIILCNWSLYANKKLLTNKDLNAASKLQIYKTIIRPTVTYGCETWAMTITYWFLREGYLEKYTDQH